MNNQEAYNSWSVTYDTAINKTRDVEAAALRQIISGENFDVVLEIGCGTGKNTEWLVTKAKTLIGIDFSEEMLAKARQKITTTTARFVQADIREEWNFEPETFDLITCSLVLEHIENLDFIFVQARKVLKMNGLFYVGEFHPFKQYEGRKARFETENGIFELECFMHHVSDFYRMAAANGLECIGLDEWWDDAEKSGVPRILTMVFRKK